MSPQQHQQQHDSPSPNGLHSRQDSIESDKASTSPAPPVEAKQEKVTTTASREAENPTDQIEQDEAQAAAFSKDAPPPDKGYAWVIAACVFGQNTVTWGMATTFGVFLSFFLDGDHYSGAGRLEYAFIGGLQVGVALIISPAATFISRKFGFRVSQVAGMLAVTLGLIFAGLSYEIWHLFLAQGVLFGAGCGLIFIPSMPVLGQWFTKKRALAYGLATGGSGAGGLVFSITSRLAIQNLSLKYAYIINGLISFVVLVPSVFLMRSRVHQTAGGWQSFQLSWMLHPGFACCFLWAFFSMIGYIIGLFTLPTYATQALGLTQSQGATIQAVLSASQMVGRPAVGMTLDKAGRLNMAIAATLIAGLAMLFIWNFADSFAVLIVFSIFEGLTFGSVWSASGPVMAETVGVDSLASALTVFWVILGLPAIFAQPIALELLKYSQNVLGWDGQQAFRIMINFSGGCFVLATIILYGAKVFIQKSWNPLTKT